MAKSKNFDCEIILVDEQQQQHQRIAERIVKKNRSSLGSIKYLVEMKGSEEMEWESEAYMKEKYPELIEEYNYFTVTGQRYDKNMLANKRDVNNQLATYGQTQQQQDNSNTDQNYPKIKKTIRTEPSKKDKVIEKQNNKQHTNNTTEQSQVHEYPQVLEYPQTIMKQSVQQNRKALEARSNTDDIISAIHIHPVDNDYVFQIQWKERQDKITPMKEYYNYEQLKALAPMLLLQCIEEILAEGSISYYNIKLANGVDKLDLLSQVMIKKKIHTEEQQQSTDHNHHTNGNNNDKQNKQIDKSTQPIIIDKQDNNNNGTKVITFNKAVKSQLSKSDTSASKQNSNDESEIATTEKPQLKVQVQGQDKQSLKPQQEAQSQQLSQPQSQPQPQSQAIPLPYPQPQPQSKPQQQQDIHQDKPQLVQAPLAIHATHAIHSTHENSQAQPQNKTHIQFNFQPIVASKPIVLDDDDDEITPGPKATEVPTNEVTPADKQRTDYSEYQRLLDQAYSDGEVEVPRLPLNQSDY